MKPNYITSSETNYTTSVRYFWICVDIYFCRVTLCLGWCTIDILLCSEIVAAY